MPIKVSKPLLAEFPESILMKIKKYRIVCISLLSVGILLNFFVYISVTYFGFIYWGPEGYYYDYFVRLAFIEIGYYLTWTAIYFSSFCILLNLLLLRFSINPYLEILKNRKDQNIEKIDQITQNYRSSISYRMFGHLFLIGVMIIELNYYPRNTELFYPYIGCNVDTGICVISGTVFFPFILAMTSFLAISLGFYLSVLVINLRERGLINQILDPVLDEKAREKLREKRKKRALSIEERRKLKIKEIREKHKQAVKEKQEKIKNKYAKLVEEEKYGKKGYKYITKQDKEKEKEKDKKQRKDKFDFT